MDWLDILLTSGLTTTALGALAFILKDWVSARLKESVAAEYDRALEAFKSEIAWRDQRRRQASELAGLFSVWMEHHYRPGKDVNEIRYALQKRYWELALWLDAPVLRAVHAAFLSAGEPGVAHKQALIAVRKLFHGQEDPIRAEELHHFDAIRTRPGG